MRIITKGTRVNTVKEIIPIDIDTLERIDASKLNNSLDLDGLKMSAMYHLFRITAGVSLYEDGGELYQSLQDSIIGNQPIRIRAWIEVGGQKYIWSYPLDEYCLVSENMAVTILGNILLDVSNNIMDVIEKNGCENEKLQVFFSHVYNKLSENKVVYHSRKTAEYDVAKAIYNSDTFKQPWSDLINELNGAKFK